MIWIWPSASGGSTANLDSGSTGGGSIMTAIPWVDLGPVLAQVLFQVLCGEGGAGLDKTHRSAVGQFGLSLIWLTVQRAKSMHRHQLSCPSCTEKIHTIGPLHRNTRVRLHLFREIVGSFVTTVIRAQWPAHRLVSISPVWCAPPEP